MAQTYEVHKNALDASMRTPAIVWQLLDHTPEDHRETETVQFRSVFNEVSYHFIASTYIADGVATFGINRVLTRTRGRALVITPQADWAAAVALFVTYWADLCDAVRADIATRNYGQDVKTDVGAVTEISHDARLSALSSPTVGVNEFEIVEFVPAFDADILEYTATAYANLIQIVAAPQDLGATFRWVFGAQIILGNSPSPTFTLTTGENIIYLHVTAQNGYTTRTYKLVITR